MWYQTMNSIVTYTVSFSEPITGMGGGYITVVMEHWMLVMWLLPEGGMSINFSVTAIRMVWIVFW